MMRPRWSLVLGLITYMLFLRLMPAVILQLQDSSFNMQSLNFPWGFSPTLALCLFGGACLRDRRWAVAIPLIAQFVGDLGYAAISGRWNQGFQADTLFVYVALAAIVGLGTLLRNRHSVGRLTLGAIGAATLFFVITNAAVWALQPFYPKTLAGLSECFVLALPFAKYDFLSTLLFTAVLYSPLGVRKASTEPSLAAVSA